MESKEENELRVAALCKKLGHLWAEEDVVAVTPEISTQKKEECSRILFGKLYSRPNVNYSAFLTAMKKAWKIDNLIYTQKDPGHFTFIFPLAAKKERILKASPWNYSNNLLVLKQCKPELPEHCYEFNHAAFWVQIGGIPLGWRVESVLQDLRNPLKSGAILDIGSNWLWVEFKYERLSHYYYSCGRIGHYAPYCSEIPYVHSPWAVSFPTQRHGDHSS